jgi:hypothetical protein
MDYDKLCELLHHASYIEREKPEFFIINSMDAIKIMEYLYRKTFTNYLRSGYAMTDMTIMGIKMIRSDDVPQGSLRVGNNLLKKSVDELIQVQERKQGKELENLKKLNS